jgi:hypothetical protein
MTHSLFPVAEKRCRGCSEVKPLSEYYANPKGRGGLRPECKDCTKARRKAWYAENADHERERVRQWALANPDKIAERVARVAGTEKKKAADWRSYLKRNYGITVDEYDLLVAEHDGVCAICKKPRPDDRKLHIDHDHASGKIRGLLCFRCNNALGDLDDDPVLFQRAADYLDRDDELIAKARQRALLLRA